MFTRYFFIISLRVYVPGLGNDGRLVSGSGDKTLRIWNSATGKLVHTLTGHTGGIRTVIQLRDGRIVTDS